MTLRLKLTGRKLKSRQLESILISRQLNEGCPLNTGRLLNTGRPLDTSRPLNTGGQLNTGCSLITGRPLNTGRSLKSGRLLNRFTVLLRHISEECTDAHLARLVAQVSSLTRVVPDTSGGVVPDAIMVATPISRSERMPWALPHYLLNRFRVAPGVWVHLVEFESFVASDVRGLRDQVCTTQGPEVDCVRQFDS